MKSHNRKNRNPVYAICSTLGTVLLIIIILMCIPFTVPKLVGYQAYAVVSGSMEPAIATGSLVYVKATAPEDVMKNEVIAFYGGRDANTVITHRVVENRADAAEFVTKGDANRTEDMNPVSYENLIGRVEFSIPHIGVVAQILTSGRGKLAAVCAIGIALILHLLAGLLDKKQL